MFKPEVVIGVVSPAMGAHTNGCEKSSWNTKACDDYRGAINVIVTIPEETNEQFIAYCSIIDHTGIGFSASEYPDKHGVVRMHVTDVEDGAEVEAICLDNLGISGVIFSKYFTFNENGVNFVD